jgi:starch synthase (maltosyl-transferring)
MRDSNARPHAETVPLTQALQHNVKSNVAAEALVPGDVLGKNYFAPAIYYCDREPFELDLDEAALLGFELIGVPHLSEAMLEALSHLATKKHLCVVSDFDVLTAKDFDGPAGDHPAWSTSLPEGERLTSLSELDPAVDYWNESIARMQAHSVNAFRCLNIEAVPPTVWRRLIGAAKQRDPHAAFYAWTVGVAPDAVSELSSCGFDCGFSSSCWWDFKSAWLEDERLRLQAFAPSIALVTPPNSAWPSEPSFRRRALDVAAFYATGWLMPAGFQRCREEDLSAHVIHLNRLRREQSALTSALSASVVSSEGSEVAVLSRCERLALIANPSIVRGVFFQGADIAGRLGSLLTIEDAAPLPPMFELPVAGSMILSVSFQAQITSERFHPPDCEAPRIAIEVITPQVDNGEFPVRRVVGERVSVEADLIADGHDKIAAELIWRPLDEDIWQRAPMRLVENDRWRGSFAVDRVGRYVYAVFSWKDVYATFVDELIKKIDAGRSVGLEVREGVLIVREAAVTGADAEKAALHSIVKALDSADDDTKRVLLLSAEVIQTMRRADPRKFAVRSHDIMVDSEPQIATFASWYEIFPRSQSGDGVRHGTFRDVIVQLPRIAGMGFNVLYFPPIHPIGRVNRKGRNNSLTPSEDDPGSPYAIGSVDGGHDALHPELGTLDDFRSLVKEASKHGLSIALDFAIQCAPDHPWLSQHKEWFDWRPDGSLRYAENPPKKYEDIVNVDFYADGAKPSLWLALRDIVQFWVDQGVRLFRVDNPHTKPFPFWAWMINDIRSRHPDVLFLAEAFTRPKVMYRLAKIGFSQSYTYFTWRNTKAELMAYLTELNDTAARDFFRPHFFVNTPDINPIFLQNSGRAGFLIRAALAATLSGLWGVYNGFELCEATPVAVGKEEYLDSEKYQIRAWDYDRPGNIIAEISKLNAIRRRNAALQSHLGIRFHTAFDDQVLLFSKSAPDGNVVLAAICLDPFNTHQFQIELPLWLFDLPDDADLAATDLMRDFDFTWRGKIQDVTLHPASPFCIWRIRPEGD